MSNETFHKTRGLKRHGPVTVIDDSEDVGPMKLYAFCKRSFPHLSKKVLINCFLSGSIFVNGEKIRCGHADESRRLVVADVIEIQIDMDASDARIIDATELSILHIQSGFAVISKPCGLSAAFDKELDKALKVKLWDGKRKQECHQLYHLEKGFSGICIVAETAENLSKLRLLACATSVGVDIEIEECDTPTHLESDWNLSVKNNAAADVRSEVQEDGAAQLITAHSHMNSFLELTYRCIICGKVGEVGERVFIKSGHSLYPVRNP